MSAFFNTTFALAMAPDGLLDVQTLSEEAAARWLKKHKPSNVANPSHLNTLKAISRILETDVTEAKGGKVLLKKYDVCLVAQAEGLPRETREFTDTEIMKATFTFRLVTVL
jgi:hypothetical protein